MTTLEKRNKLAWILDALALAAVLQYAAFRFLQSTMFVFYYSDTYKMITMGLLIVFGGIRYLYVAWGKLKQSEDKKKHIARCIGAWLLALPFFYVGFLHNYKFLIFLPICCMCLYDMQVEKVLKAFFVTIGTLLLATVLCSLSGTVRNLTNVGSDGRVVAAYGIINTTDFASYFTFLLLTIWCGMKGREWSSSVLFATFVGIISYFAFILTDSRTVIDVGAILLIFVLWDCIVEHKKRIQRVKIIVNILSVLAFPIIGLIVIFLVYSFAQQEPWAIQIDQVLSGRLSVTLDPYLMYGIRPFGNLIENMHGRGGTLLSHGWSAGYGYIDIEYATLAIKYGWVITAVVTGVWVWMTAKAVKHGNRRIAFAMAIMAVHAVSEARILDINYNIFLVMPFCMFEHSGREKEKAKKTAWVPEVSGMALVGIVFLLLPHILSLLRTLFASKDWNNGTAAFMSVMVCAGIVACICLAWYFMNRIVQGNSKRAIIGITVVLCICMVGMMVINNEIGVLMITQAESLDEEEKIISSVKAVATQPIYVAEQEAVYKRRFGDFDDHIISTEEVRKGSIFTDSDVETLGIVSSGGMYTAVSENTGLYSYDPAVIIELANEGYNWTPYYSGRRTVKLSDMALFNGMKLTEGKLDLIGPCQVATTNMEIDQFGGTYEVKFTLSGIMGNGEIGRLIVLGEKGERLIDSQEIIASDDGGCVKTIKYSIRSTPKVSFGIEVNEGAKLTVEEIVWSGAYQKIDRSSEVEIRPDGRIIMTTSNPDNRFNIVHFQLYSDAGELLCSFGEGYEAGKVSGEYMHDLPSDFYILRLKGNTNMADEWMEIKVFLEEEAVIQYCYDIEELSTKRIVIRDVMINDLPLISLVE